VYVYGVADDGVAWINVGMVSVCGFVLYINYDTGGDGDGVGAICMYDVDDGVGVDDNMRCVDADDWIWCWRCC